MYTINNYRWAAFCEGFNVYLLTGQIISQELFYVYWSKFWFKWNKLEQIKIK